MTDSLDNIFQIGESLEQRLVEIEDKLEDQINKIMDLSQIGSVFTSLLDLSLILPTVMETALNIVKGEVGEIIIFRNDDEPKTVNWGLPPKILQQIKTENGINIIDQVKNSGEVVIINDPKFNTEGKDDLARINLHSLITAPLKAKEKVVGVITIANKEDQQEFNSEDKFSLELMGNFAAIAVVNAELHKEALEKQKIDNELKLAEQVQNTLMPEAIENFEGISFNAYHVQARQVGGDLYDIIKLDDNRYLFVVADVSNKGMPAALIMTSVRSYFRVAAENIDSLAEFTSRINKLLCQDIHKLGSMFVSMIIGLVDLEQRKLVTVNAGHPPGYLIRDNSIDRMKTGGIFLGQFPEINYKEKETPIKQGDKLFFYTDGMFECVDNNGEMLGLKGLEKFLMKYIDTSWNDFSQKLKELLKEYSFDSGRIDDTTLMKIEIK